MAKCQNLTTKKFFFVEIDFFSLYFRELSDLEQKKNQKKKILKKSQKLIFSDFFGPKKAQNSRFCEI